MRVSLFLRPLLFCVVLLALVGISRPLAPPDRDMPPEQELWYWVGGRQLDPVAFADMTEDVLEMMPIVTPHQDLINLLSETVATETSFGYAVRDKSGKTLGVYQILLSTAEFILDRLQDRHPRVLDIVLAYMEPEMDLQENLMLNLHFQTAMAISYYWLRAGDALLTQTASLEERARLYKQKWNTSKGRATVAKYIRDSKKYLFSGR